MKILIACSTLDLKYKLGCTPSWWQLFKALHETGNEVIVTPYLGDPVESLWWRTYPNPCSGESKLFNSFLELKKKFRKLHPKSHQKYPIIGTVTDRYIKEKWKNHLIGILKTERNIDAVLIVNVPLNHIEGIPTYLRKEFGIPIAYFEGDMPICLSSYVAGSGYKFCYYDDADISEFDTFFTNSKGVIPELKEMGGRNIVPLYFAADPELFKPIVIEKKIDVSFFGYGDAYREKWMHAMVTRPSKDMVNINFSIGGNGFKIDLGQAHLVGDLTYSAFRDFCCASNICLNITRESHASVYGSSSARPFELAAFGACIVSNPYNGIEEWFEVGKELVLVDSVDEVKEIYQWLLDSEEDRNRISIRARERILKDHTYRNRAASIIQELGKIRVSS